MLVESENTPEVPEGYPGYLNPTVQAVAAELLGNRSDSDHWRTPVTTNAATALAAAVRAVHAVDECRREDVERRPRTRVLRPGSKVGRTLYDAESGELLGMVDTPELASWLCETVWREVRSQVLPAGEVPVHPGLVAHLNDLYGLDGARTETPPRDDAAPQTVNVESGPMEARQPTASELANELVWQTRRLLDAQWDVAHVAARVQAAAEREQ